MKRKNILKGAGVLLIAAFLVFSTIAVTANTSTTPILSHKIFTEVHEDYTGGNSNGVVLWDNGMHYTCWVASQWDPTEPFEATPADDFQFEETTVVTDVHWIGGYYTEGDYDYDWNVSFYMDRGDGMAPGNKIYEQVFPNAEVHETFIENETWDIRVFSYWVDLADAITFTGGEKYWISIQGIGDFPPQSGWTGHYLPIVLHEGVWKSPYFGVYDWTDSSELWGKHFDWCFQLTGDGEPAVPDLECDGDIRWDEVPPGAFVNSTFTVINSGDIGSMLEWEVQSFPDWGTDWSAKWIVDWLNWTDCGFVGTTTPEEIFVEVKAPDEGNTEFEGEIVLVNVEDPDDTCTIPVTLVTPCESPFLQLLELLMQRFPILGQILNLIL